MRDEAVVVPPQPVITEDNLVVSIDTVIYFRSPIPRRHRTRSPGPYLGHRAPVTVTSVQRHGSLDLEETLTSRDQINARLRACSTRPRASGASASTGGAQGRRPPASIKESMEKQMRAYAPPSVLNAEGSKQAAILNAEGQKTAAVLTAEGDAAARVLRAQGEAEAIAKVFDAIHAGDPDEKVLAYQYLQALPLIANGSSSKVWVLPAELSRVMAQLGQAFDSTKDGPPAG
jgi:regulator of protease activity HflC (stomatin/prohibitin superfamily)